jgi:uncharacterized membrane protein
MQEIKRILRDRATNNLVVGFVLAFATVTFVQNIVNLWDSGSGYWLGQFTREVIAYIILLVIAAYVARMAR